MAKQRKSSGKHHKKDITEIRSKKSKDTSTRQRSKRRVSRKKISSRKVGYAIVILLIAIVIVSAFILHQPQSTPSNHSNGNNGDNIGIDVGQIAPNFELTDIDGYQFTLEVYRGNIVILDFMATWCGPCGWEMIELKKVFENYSHNGVSIISIDVDDRESIEDLMQFKNKYGCDWVFTANGGNVWDIYREYSVSPGIPTLYIIDKQGIIAFRHEGFTDYSTLSSEIDKLL